MTILKAKPVRHEFHGSAGLNLKAGNAQNERDRRRRKCTQNKPAANFARTVSQRSASLFLIGGALAVLIAVRLIYSFPVRTFAFPHASRP